MGSEMIGKGSFGKIYKASFAGFAVAVKEVQAANISCVFTLIQQTAHLFYELSSIRQCQHPNIVELIGAVVDFPSMDESNSPTFGLVLELCSCGSLHHVLFETRHNLSIDRKVLIGGGVAAGLAHIHGMSILHRERAAGRRLRAQDRRLRLLGMAQLLASFHRSIVSPTVFPTS